MRVEVLHHTLGVGPAAPFWEGEIGIGEGFAARPLLIRRIVEDVERRFVAPRLDHQHGGGDAVLLSQLRPASSTSA